MSFLQEIKAGTRHFKAIKFPGTDRIVKLHILSYGQEQSAETGAEQFFIQENIPVAFHNVNDFEQEKTLRKMFIALRDDADAQLAENVETFKRQLTKFELDALVDEYNAFTFEHNPSLAEMSEERFAELLDNVKKNPTNAVMNCSNTVMLKRLITCLAELLQTSPTDSGPTSD